MASILQNWVIDLGLRHQGVLLTAVRGCDTVARDEQSKMLVRYYRACILNPHCGDVKKAVSFMVWPDDYEARQVMLAVIKSHDHLPHHYLLHLVHAAEILGYKHPDKAKADLWTFFYRQIVKKFHMNPETQEQLDHRLNADEDTFGSNQ